MHSRSLRPLARTAMLTLLGLCALCTSGYAQGSLPLEHKYATEGRHDKVIEYLEGQERQGVVLTYMRLQHLCAAYYYGSRDYGRTLTCLDKQQARIDQGDYPKFYGRDSSQSTLDDMRLSLLLDLGQYDAVISGAEQRLAREAPDPARHMHALGFVGIAQGLKGDKDAARATAQRMETIVRGKTGIARQNDAMSIARVYFSIPDGPSAYAVMSQSDADPEAAATMHQLEVQTGNKDLYAHYRRVHEFMLAKAALLAGKTEEARGRYDTLLGHSIPDADNIIGWELLADRAGIALADGQAEQAAQMFAKAVDIIEQQRRTIGSDASKMGFVGDKQGLYQGMVRALLASGRVAEALEYVERAKSRALVDLLGERQNLAEQMQDQAGAAESLKLLASLEQRYMASGVKSDEQQRLRSAISGTQADLRRKAPELASLVTVGAPKAADIQAQLGADETLLEFYGQGDALFAFIVTRGSIKAVKLDGKGLEADVRALRLALHNVRTDAWKPLAQKLHARLLAPVSGALANPRLIIVGHGALHYLPFNTLYDGKGFLIDRVTVQLLPSASVLQFLASRKPATAKDMLLLGNPDLGDKAMDLPGAEAEAKAIKGLWPGSTMFMRKAATKSSLTKAGQLFKVIHVAAHGEFVSDQPLASRLLLSPEGDDNGQLTAGDLYGLRLNADLVTLSACETGMGKVLSGDDVVGLTRGFLYAGANSIVASLWPVSDDETRFLMTSFYGNLKKMPKADALRQAQLDTKKKYAHPFYWSSFQLTGMGR